MVAPRIAQYGAVRCNSPCPTIEIRIYKGSKLFNLLIITITYTVVLLSLRQFDLEIFTEIGIYVEKVRSPSRTHLSDSEYSRAFHLDNKFRNNESNVILIWSPPFGAIQRIGSMEDDGCVQTYDRTAITVAKAVIFHFAEIHDHPYWLPLHQRKASQRWIWYCQEPPTLTSSVFHKSLTPMNGIFNWTMTYRVDSDIVVSYQQHITPNNKSVEEMMQNKRSSASGIWLVSNCKSSFRNKLIQELQQYVTIDVKGKCSGDILCRGSCAITAVSSYKFVFTLENSRCKDYITEKFFNWGLNTEAVPVVLGPSRSSYEKYASAKSFIHIDDFENVELLGKYLQSLVENDKEYAEILKYKSSLYPEFHLHPPVRHDASRSVCSMLKNSSNGESIAKELDTWWYGSHYSSKNVQSSESTISICQHEDGSSAKDYHGVFVFWYHFVLLLLYIITCTVVIRASARHEA